MRQHRKASINSFQANNQYISNTFCSRFWCTVECLFFCHFEMRIGFWQRSESRKFWHGNCQREMLPPRTESFTQMWWWIRKEHSYFSYTAYSVFNLRSPKSRNFDRKGPKVHFKSRFAVDLLIVRAWPSYIKRCGQLQATPDTSHRGSHFSSCCEIAGKQPKSPKFRKPEIENGKRIGTRR